jgi:hypothetical protein
MPPSALAADDVQVPAALVQKRKLRVPPSADHHPVGMSAAAVLLGRKPRRFKKASGTRC